MMSAAAFRQVSNSGKDWHVEDVHPRGILRPGVVETHDPPGEGVRALGRRTPQDMQEARHSEPAARMVGEEGRRQGSQANPAPERQGWHIRQDHDRCRRTAAGARADRDRPRECPPARVVHRWRGGLAGKPDRRSDDRPAPQGEAFRDQWTCYRGRLERRQGERLELALGRIAAAAEALGIKLARGEKSASFQCDGETIAFSISEGVRREKHVPTEKELAEQEAARKRRARRWNSPGSWDDDDFAFSSLRGPEWDYHPTGQLAFELEQSYLLGGSPRRSFRDAKVQRIETMASDIAVGIAVLAAAKKDDRLKREEQARRDAEARRLRELALRRDHIAERRGKALDEVLEEMASLDRLRRLVANLRAENLAERAGRVAEFLVMAERRLASREAALSADGLEQRFEKNKLFGDDDDHAFRPPYGYY